MNVVFVGLPEEGGRWVLIDAGVYGSADTILKSARERFGKTQPQCIVLTHGHFDHVGGITELLKEWKVPVYAHPSEFPHLNGAEPYPAPDPSVGGGMMSSMSRFYPRGPIDIKRSLRPLPPEGSLPFLPGWKWIHTPGHTNGHISLWREADRLVIAGDAFVTTAQESAYSVAVQEPEMHGPPMYYTSDWMSAKKSVQVLASLRPSICVTGHGPAMQGPRMSVALDELALRFDEVAVPKSHAVQGRQQASDEGHAHR